MRPHMRNGGSIMAFCEFCGQQVPDGQLCNCPGAQQARGQAPAPAPAQIPMPAPAAPAQTTFCEYCGTQIPAGAQCTCPGAQAARQMQYQGAAAKNPAGDAVAKIKNFFGTIADKFKNGDKKTKIKMGAIAAAPLVLIIGLIIFFNCVSFGYKGAIKDLEKGITKADAEKIIDAVVPDDVIDTYKKDFGKSAYKGILKEYSEELDEFIEDEMGRNYKFKMDIRSEMTLKKKEVSAIEDFLVDYYGTEATVKEGYKLKVRTSIKGKDDHDSETETIYVVKLGNGGGGWKVVPNYSSGLTWKIIRSLINEFH